VLRHEIIIKVKKGREEQEVDERLRLARATAARIPVVRGSSAGRSAGEDCRVAVLRISVDDEEALFRLQIHHLHATIVGLLQEMAEDICVSDEVIWDR
jgi:hypothetical protein